MVFVQVKLSPNIVKFTSTSIIIILLLATFTYWLWQRQPKPANFQTPPATSSDTVQKKAADISFEVSPADGSVLKETPTTFQGKTNPNEYVVLSSNSANRITQANSNGQFEFEVELAEGINLIKFLTIDENLAEKQASQLAVFLDENSDANTVYAGSVKSIFENSITVSSLSGEKTIRIKTSTEVILPKTKQGKDNSDIRVGDYIIALGSTLNEKDFNTILLEIIREDKPQNVQEVTSGILLTTVRENVFSLRKQKDGSIVELILNKNSEIVAGGKETKAENIVKDKKAIAIYHRQEDENSVDLVYLLP